MKYEREITHSLNNKKSCYTQKYATRYFVSIASQNYNNIKIMWKENRYIIISLLGYHNYLSFLLGKRSRIENVKF